MAVFSGKYGFVSDGATRNALRNWRISQVTNAPALVNSTTRLGTARVKGIEDWNGSYEFHGLDALVFPGDTFAFIGYGAPTSGTRGTAGITYEGTAIVSELNLRWNWGDNEAPQGTISFEGAAILGQSTGSHEDTADSANLSICGLKVEEGDTTTTAAWANISRVDWRVRANNPSYINSSTISGSDCYVARTRGTLDFDLDVTDQNDDFTTPAGVALHDNARIRMYIDAVKYWQLTWCKVVDISDLTVDVETGAIIERTVNLKMQASNGTTTGSVLDPDGNTVWPL